MMMKLGRISQIDIDQLKKIYYGFNFIYNNQVITFNSITNPNTGKEYQIKINGEIVLTGNYDIINQIPNLVN